MMQTWSIGNGQVEAEVQSLGGMCAPVRFRLDGGWVSPLAVAPWADDREAGTLPGVLRRLRGEWPCVPFGIAGRDDLPAAWRPAADAAEPDPFPHGYSSNHDWTLEALAPDGLTLCIAYPEWHPIRGLRRTIRLREALPRIEFELAIEVRDDCRLPIGIHPTFALPGRPGSNRLVLDPGCRGWTPPVAAEPGISRMETGVTGASPGAVPTIGEGQVNIGRLPLVRPAEELFLATRANGFARLECMDAGYAATLSWDPAVFASCMLWVSNRGRTAYPWSGRHLALGIEPVTSAFDLGTAVSANPANPLAADGQPTARDFHAGEVVTTTYAIEVAPLATQR